MVKKLLLGAFIVYNIFAMSAYTVSANTFAHKTAINDTKADQREVAASIDDIKQDAYVAGKEDMNIAVSDLMESQKSEEKELYDEKNNDDISVASDLVDSTGCDSTGTPGVTVLSPNGGEVYNVGQQITVKWETCNIPSGMNALIILNDEINSIGGDLATSTPNDGIEVVTLPTSATWPGPFGTYFKVRVSFKPFGGYNGNQLSDASDNVFTINAPANTCNQTASSSETVALDVNNPSAQNVTAGAQNVELARVKLTNTGSQDICYLNGLQIGSNDNVNNYITNVRVIDLSTNTQIGQTTDTFDFNGSYYWSWVEGYDLPVTIGSSKVFKIVGDIKTSAQTGTFEFGIFGVNHSGGFGAQASGLPTIGNLINVTSTTTPSITVLSPNGGEVYQVGQQINITWNSQNIPLTDYVNIEMTSNLPATPGVPIPGLRVPNTGSAQWTAFLNANLGWLPGTHFKIRILHYAPNAQAPDALDLSDNLFTITSGVPTFCNPDDSTTVPAVDVLSPNGGEHFLPVEMPVSWRTCLIPANTQMSIDLLMSRTGSPDLVRHLATTVNDGAEVVPLPNTTSWPQMIYGNNFKVRIYPTNSPSYGPRDQSNGNFSISPASVTVTTDSTTPPAGTVQVNNTASTNNVTLLKFKISANDSDLTIRKIPVQIKNGSSSNVSNNINTIKLYKGNTLIDSLDGTQGTPITGCPGICTIAYRFVFSNLSGSASIIPMGTTSNFTIAVDVKPLSGNYAEGETLTVSIPTIDVADPAYFSVFDQNGDQLLVSQRSGYAQGQTQTLRTGVVTVVMGNSQNTPHYDSMGNVTSVTYVIPLTLTSYGDDHYIGKTAQLTTNATLSNAFAYAFLVAQFPSVPETTSVATSALSSFDAPQEALSYRLSDGVTTHFTLTVELITPTTQNAMYRVNLRQIRFFSNSVLSIGGTNMELLPRVAYESAAAFINN